mmetsp:Transcript_109190/g.326557  ORF Transcript_109190/g.326557 Transcript_109190/m.326557 type:complete len:128 (+) Transcript_109190:664-1047(+)
MCRGRSWWEFVQLFGKSCASHGSCFHAPSDYLIRAASPDSGLRLRRRVIVLTRAMFSAWLCLFVVTFGLLFGLRVVPAAVDSLSMWIAIALGAVSLALALLYFGKNGLFASEAPGPVFHALYRAGRP